jgi:hypothetical protein
MATEVKNELIFGPYLNNNRGTTAALNTYSYTPHVMWVSVTMAWCVLGLQREDMASIYGE